MNILVTLADGESIVKVIDFGVAKATNQQLTEKTLFTAYGQMIGTPRYMSPEQAEMSCLGVDSRPLTPQMFDVERVNPYTCRHKHKAYAAG